MATWRGFKSVISTVTPDLEQWTDKMDMPKPVTPLSAWINSPGGEMKLINGVESGV